jgi:hypothetical protein
MPNLRNHRKSAPRPLVSMQTSPCLSAPMANSEGTEPFLVSEGWNPQTRAALETLIRSGAGKQLPVVFDFDNTLVCGDIGEATLAVLAKSGVLSPKNVPPALCPPIHLEKKGTIDIRSCSDVTEYYEALLRATAHQPDDPAPLANGYSWAAEILESLRPAEVLEATREAYRLARPGCEVMIEVTPGKTSYPAPWFYPEMVECVRQLLLHGFDPWVVSASNIWSVRWMVLHGLNPLLEEGTRPVAIRPDRVVGISTLLRDRQNRLHKDSILARPNPKYAALDPKALASFRLTSRLQFPVPVYSGKIACILDYIGCPPYLCIGDSPGDLPMMSFSQNRLWIARLDKTAYQQKLKEAMDRTGKDEWLIQGTSTRHPAGFISGEARC